MLENGRLYVTLTLAVLPPNILENYIRYDTSALNCLTTLTFENAVDGCAI